ncbi:MAG: ATP-binding protein [Pyrinomonadaceae bacterium]
MSIRAKLLLVFIVLGLVPMLLLSVGYYRSGERAVERLLRADVTNRAAQVAAGLTAQLTEREADLSELAGNPAFDAYLREQPTLITPPAATGADLSVPVTTAQDGARVALESFGRSHRNYFTSLTLISADGRALARVDAPNGADVVFRYGNALPDKSEVDERVWAEHDPNTTRPLRGPLTLSARGASLRYTTPVWGSAAVATQPGGAIVAELRLDALFAQLDAGPTDTSGPTQSARTKPQQLVLALDHSGQLIYHTNRALNYQPVASVMPGFTNIAHAMMTGASGAEFFNTPQDGTRWLAAYQPVAGLDLSVAVAANATAAGAGLQLIGTIGIVLTILTALAAAVILTVVIQRTSRRINRVADAAAQIAAGNLEQRILVQSTDETRLLAESFNLMSDRLREHIAREAESKQFQSFLRLSAMLTHDLKNSITGLSILVNNMERHIHREEFRADAITSLRAATDKLRALVARLNEPVQTLSGEYRHALRTTDLVPVIKRVLATTAQPIVALHRVELDLPAQLVAAVDSERIERVLENLVINALEAMGAQNGRLTVAAGAEGEQHVFISVRDTGLGMTEEFIRTRLFRPFATTKERGIGLGLYTCREIVAAHSGRIDVESEIGVGTCFRVVLPSTPVKRFSQASAARSQQPTDAKTTRTR